MKQTPISWLLPKLISRIRTLDAMGALGSAAMAAYSASNGNWLGCSLYASATAVGLMFWKFQPVQHLHKSLFKVK